MWTRCGLTILMLLSWAFYSPPAQAVEQFKTQTLQNAAVATGNGTELPVETYTSVGLQVTIAETAELTFEVTMDGSSAGYVAAPCVLTSDMTSTAVSTASASGGYQCNVAGAALFRARISSWTSGAVTVFARATTAVFAKRGGGGAGTLDQAFDGGKAIDGANSEANCFRVGTSTNYYCVYSEAGTGLYIKPEPLANNTWRCWTNLDCVIYDEEGAAAMLTINADAVGNLKYIWGPGYRPIKTLPLTADALYMQGAAALVTDTALISGGLISPYITITDADTAGFHRYLVMDPKWDGGTVTATITVVNTNAVPANNLELDVSGTCYPAGTAIATTISATGEQPANIDFDAAGACGGSACSQNDPASATTAAITINGTPAGGAFCGFQAQVDATATTETVTGLKIVQMDIHYAISQGF